MIIIKNNVLLLGIMVNLCYYLEMCLQTFPQSGTHKKLVTFAQHSRINFTGCPGSGPAQLPQGSE